MKRFAILALVLLAACGTSNQTGSVAPSAPTSACASAFTDAAGVDAYSDNVSDLYPAIRACGSLQEWTAAFDAVDGAGFTGSALSVLGNACLAPEVSSEPLCVAASGGSGANPTEVPSTAGEAAAFKNITLKGKGKKVAKFKIPKEAAAIAVVSYSGSSNFAITSIASNGGHNDLLVNTIGKYKGVVLFDTSSDEHSVAFDIEAAGSWTIVIKPVTAARSWDGVSSLNGTGDHVVRIKPPASGLATLGLTHKGKGNFAVISYGPNGTDLLVNEIGKYSGEVLLPGGSFLLGITADGSWTAAGDNER